MRGIKWLLATGLVLVTLVASFAGRPAVQADDTVYTQIVKFEGVVESCPTDTRIGAWVIGGKTVQVVEGTLFVEIGGAAAPGAQVVVVANQLEDETLEAVLIRVQPPVTPIMLTIKGTVSNMGVDYMLVNAFTIRLTNETQFEGQLRVGASVTAEVRLTSGGYVASKVTVEPTQDHNRVVEFSGLLESMEDTLWVVDGYEIVVNEYTVIDGTPEIGDEVDVRAFEAEDGTLTAIEIKVRGDGKSDYDYTNFKGLIEHFPARLLGTWMIGGRAVMVTEQTVLLGTPQVGLPAEVQATLRSDGLVVATQITILQLVQEPVSFSGAIEAFPARLLGTWKIDGRSVMVTDKTEIAGTPLKGALASVEATRFGDGLLVASRIDIAGPEVTTTPTPQRGGTPEATVTPRGDGSPTQTPHPSATPRGRLAPRVGGR